MIPAGKAANMDEHAATLQQALAAACSRGQPALFTLPTHLGLNHLHNLTRADDIASHPTHTHCDNITSAQPTPCGA